MKNSPSNGRMCSRALRRVIGMQRDRCAANSVAMKSIAFRYIYRIDNATSRTHAWLVQVQRHKKNAAKVFSDGVWGSKRKALAAARAWRDARIQPLAQYEHELWRRNVVRRNNRSGMVGVARYVRKPAGGNQSASGSAYWLAFWIDEQGVYRQRTFSVKRWGERNAKQMAIQER